MRVVRTNRAGKEDQNHRGLLTLSGEPFVFCLFNFTVYFAQISFAYMCTRLVQTFTSSYAPMYLTDTLEFEKVIWLVFCFGLFVPITTSVKTIEFEAFFGDGVRVKGTRLSWLADSHLSRLAVTEGCTVETSSERDRLEFAYA